MVGTSATLPAIMDRLSGILREVFLRDDLTVTPDLTAKDVPGWDSFKQIEIILAVEEAYGIKFRTRDLDRLDSVGDLADAILSKTAT